MAKLGYTWYPKDWGNSEAVFELTLIERGLYRELIDMAMLNDNKTVINLKIWARKFGSSIDEIESILITLVDLKLIEIEKESLFIPSCESRLKLVRGGRKGGAKSKPNPKPDAKPTIKPNTKPDSNQKKDKLKEKEKVKEEDINYIYSLYPAKCVVKHSSTGKSSKTNKTKIKTILKDITVKELEYIIKRYIQECRTSKTYMKNFTTFLNNLPDYEESSNTNQVPNPLLDPLTKDVAFIYNKIPQNKQELFNKGYTQEDINYYIKNG